MPEKVTIECGECGNQEVFSFFPSPVSEIMRDELCTKCNCPLSTGRNITPTPEIIPEEPAINRQKYER